MSEQAGTRIPMALRRNHNLREKLQFIRGKVWRFYVGHFRKGFVAQRLAKRLGDCKRCGACCQLLLRCPYGVDCAEGAGCKIYERRPINCRIFPLNNSDLSDRDLMAPDQPCGFHFEE